MTICVLCEYSLKQGPANNAPHVMGYHVTRYTAIASTLRGVRRGDHWNAMWCMT